MNFFVFFFFTLTMGFELMPKKILKTNRNVQLKIYIHAEIEF